MAITETSVAGSFRDPSGFVFSQDGVIYRQVNRQYAEDYDLLMSSRLYEGLVELGLLVAHLEVGLTAPVPEIAYRIIRPEVVPFISYPYEWSFSQLKDAALVLLRIQQHALSAGMCLKDCSAYNVQFHSGRPLLIDTLSFERYREGEPWVAYRQFCQHFLAPLALMSYTDIRLSQLLRVHIDGIPLDLASKLLPWRTRLILPLLLHLHLHARGQAPRKKDGSRTIRRTKPFSRLAMIALTDDLRASVRRLVWKGARSTDWAGYAGDLSHYSGQAIEEKKRFVAEAIDQLSPRTLWDLGANQGMYSRIASERGTHTVSFDLDPGCVELNYLKVRDKKEQNLLPLVMDLFNPSPGIGWANSERMSLLCRGPADMALALALLHHLAISNNAPLHHIAEFLARTCRSLVVEFVPKSDAKALQLLAGRQDVFADYTEERFREAFSSQFNIIREQRVPGSERTLYLMLRTG
jgi:ribosomal protein L11 methylase PrmA